MITTEFVFLRHGEAACNVAGLVGGPATCTGLTVLGRSQVEQAAHRLLSEHRERRPFAHLYTGPRLRLRQTGEILSRTLALPLAVESGLDGPIHGAADGKPWREVKAAADGGPHAHPDTPWAEGADTWNGFLRRATSRQRHHNRLGQQRWILDRHNDTAHLLASPAPDAP